MIRCPVGCRPPPPPYPCPSPVWLSLRFPHPSAVPFQYASSESSSSFSFMPSIQLFIPIRVSTRNLLVAYIPCFVCRSLLSSSLPVLILRRRRSLSRSSLYILHSVRRWCAVCLAPPHGHLGLLIFAEGTLEYKYSRNQPWFVRTCKSCVESSRFLSW